MRIIFPFILFVCLSMLSTSVKGQVNLSGSTRSNNSFDRFRQEVNEDFNQFRAQANEEFERFLAEAWTEYQCFIGESGMFATPKPSQLVTPTTNAGKSLEADPSFQTRTIPETDRHHQVVPFPIEPGMTTIRFYGRELGFHLPESLRVTAKGTGEGDIAQYYKTMSSCLEGKRLHRELTLTAKCLGLNPWGYYLLLRTLAEKTFTDNNDRVLFCFYMLHSNGFLARVGRGRQSKQLILLLAIDNRKEVYSLPFFRINGVKYYAVYGGQKGEDAYSYHEKADDDSLRQLGLDFKNAPCLSPCDKVRTMRLAQTGIEIGVPFSTANLRYYDDIPLTVFPVYFKGGMGLETLQAFDSILTPLCSTNDKAQMVTLLLEFVQNAFAYKIDEEQFGHEKYFFPEEVIGYPYSDCEDRCALFANLVHRYTGCDIVGILYPDHLATAVCLPDDVTLKGASISHHGRSYILCDPTFPGAAMGTVIPEYENTPFDVVDIR